MILDALKEFDRYVGANPLFPKVASFLKSVDLSKLPVGHHEIQGEDLFVNIVDAAPKSRDAARLETHDRMIDIQIPISGEEEHGWSSRHLLPAASYNENDDISFYEGKAQTYYRLLPGQFAIYFPSDGHAPAITSTTLRKAIFKVKA